MENNLIYTTRSRQDLDDIWDYISFDLQNLPSAERILNRIMDAAEQLKLFPESGALLSSVAPLDHELYLDERFLVSGKYLIFYHAFRNDIYIDRVLYGGRDYLEKQGYICRTERRMNSRFGNTVCRTPAQIAAEKAMARESVPRHRDCMAPSYMCKD